MINGHESRLNLFGLLTNSTQRICLVASGGRKPMIFRSLVRRFPATPHMSTKIVKCKSYIKHDNKVNPEN